MCTQGFECDGPFVHFSFVFHANHYTEAYMSENLQTLVNVEGIIKWFDARKGFGFIIGPQGQDIFVHFSVIEQDQGFRTLRDGEKVTYSAQSGSKGWAATAARATARVAAPTA